MESESNEYTQLYGCDRTEIVEEDSLPRKGGKLVLENFERGCRETQQSNNNII